MLLVVPENKGAVTDRLTITFTTTSAFTCTGGLSGINYTSGGGGSRLATFAPTNPNTATPYFTIPASAWSGSFLVGEVFEFDIFEAAQALWVKEFVPEGANSISNNSTWIGIGGESA